MLFIKKHTIKFLEIAKLLRSPLTQHLPILQDIPVEWMLQWRNVLCSQTYAAYTDRSPQNIRHDNKPIWKVSCLLAVTFSVAFCTTLIWHHRTCKWRKIIQVVLWEGERRQPNHSDTRQRWCPRAENLGFDIETHELYIVLMYWCATVSSVICTVLFFVNMENGISPYTRFGKLDFATFTSSK